MQANKSPTITNKIEFILSLFNQHPTNLYVTPHPTQPHPTHPHSHPLTTTYLTTPDLTANSIADPSKESSPLSHSFAISKDLIYQKIIEIGQDAPKLPTSQRIPENIVDGCQSLMYLHSEVKDNLMIYQAESEALISAGLAKLLTDVYSGESPETVLTVPPTYIKELGIEQSLSPSRVNGLGNIYLKMKQEALKAILKKQTNV